ncbi:MAG: hypothetical protein E4G94_10880 [ANME-2 cluster archaeon]|nr:MAG: hypothetical protein E4G94_10880 [ANME-2 cluster archaeon]
MQKIAYTIILTDKKQHPYEYSDVLDAMSVEHAVIILASKGYLIREVRVANTEDLRLFKLKQFRDKLAGKKASTEVHGVQLDLVEPKRRSGWVMIILLLAIVSAILFLFSW